MQINDLITQITQYRVDGGHDAAASRLLLEKIVTGVHPSLFEQVLPALGFTATDLEIYQLGSTVVRNYVTQIAEHLPFHAGIDREGIWRDAHIVRVSDEALIAGIDTREPGAVWHSIAEDSCSWEGDARHPLNSDPATVAAWIMAELPYLATPDGQ